MNFRRVVYSTKEGFRIWYLITCKTQEEQKILTICRKNLSPEALQDIFVLTYDRMRKYEGIWHLERQLLFPGSVFLESNNEKILLKELGKCNVIAPQENLFIRMSRKEEQLLKRLCGVKHHLEMSRGVIRRGETKIIEGPLKGMESRISRIDRHKRLARVQFVTKSGDYEIHENGLSFCYISAGLEITERIV